MPKPNRGPYLKPNKQGILEITWSEKGRTKRRSTGTTDSAEAQQALAAFILNAPREADSERPFVGDVLSWYRDGHVAEKVVDKQRIDDALKPLRVHFGELRVCEVTPDEVRRYIADRRAGRLGERRRKVGDATIRKELSVMVAAINDAVEAKRLTLADVPSIPLPDKAEPRDRWLTKDELAALVAAAAGRARLFCHIAYWTASRKRAVETMTRGQVDLAARVIHLNPAGRRQTTKRRPPVPIADALIPVLAVACQGLHDADFVLGHPGNIRKSFRTACKRAGLGIDVTPHIMRHTRATHMAQAGVPMWDIAGILGDTVETVQRNYLHHCPEHLRRAVNA